MGSWGISNENYLKKDIYGTPEKSLSAVIQVRLTCTKTTLEREKIRITISVNVFYIGI